MTREKLESIHGLKQDLKILENELERIHEQSLIRSPLPSAAHGSGVSDKVGDRAATTADLELRIFERRLEIFHLCNEAVDYIRGINPALTRQIVYYRCVCSWGWHRIAANVRDENGETLSEEALRQRYCRFMKKNID